MLNEKHWIYWPEQCDYCINRNDCQYKDKVKEYIHQLTLVNDRGIYGTLNWKCDYFLLDIAEYEKNNFWEICVE